MGVKSERILKAIALKQTSLKLGQIWGQYMFSSFY